MKIDSHHHVWDLAIHPQDWMQGPEFDPIRQNFSMQDLREQSSGTGVEKFVVVQTVINYKETPDLLDLALQDSMIAGVVGFLRMDSADAISHLDIFQAHPGAKYLVGIRDAAHHYPDPEYLEIPQVIKNCQELGKRGIAYDLLTKTLQLPSAIALVAACPDTVFVMDHISKPYIAAGTIEPWAKLMRELASFPNVYCKVSGLVTEADLQKWKVSDFVPYINLVLETFGASRSMFGSDWPVCRMGGSYKEIVKLVEDLTTSLSDSEKENLWRHTVTKAYGLSLTI